MQYMCKCYGIIVKCVYVCMDVCECVHYHTSGGKQTAKYVKDFLLTSFLLRVKLVYGLAWPQPRLSTATGVAGLA